jgi:putative ABC transport system ATP-binding protein
MIELRSVTKTYELGKTKVEALRGVSLRIERGDFAVIVGPSGSGKTTMLNIAGLLDRATSGEVLIDDEDVTALSADARADARGKRIGFIFQGFNLVPVFDVRQNIELSLLLAKAEGGRRAWKQRVSRAVEEVGLSEYADHKPSELSGGQRQRVAIARALVKKPEIILADEPTANLDSKTAFSIIELMRDLNEAEKTTFVFSTHDDRVLKYARRVIRIEDGEIKE